MNGISSICQHIIEKSSLSLCEWRPFWIFCSYVESLPGDFGDFMDSESGTFKDHFLKKSAFYIL